MEPRDLSSTITGNNFSSHQEFILQLVALIAAGLSILAGGFALYWFTRIRTHFRHKLVTFLICSDLFKAIWYFVSAAVAVRLNPVRFGNGFCQASGFFLAFSIEASDYAILIIAIHSALCIFRPKTHLGESGLYNIRYLVYALWLCLPILLAGLGLLHGGVYVNTGAFCFLPLRPYWYRLGLSWIPRYVIFLVILLLYARIYWFVSSNFKNFHRTTGDSYKTPSDPATQSGPRRTVSYFVGARASKQVSKDVDQARSRSSKEARENATEPSDPGGIEGNGPAWENYTFGSSTIPLSKPRDNDITPALSQFAKASVSTQRTSVPDLPLPDGRQSLAEFLAEKPPRLDTTLITEEVNSETKARQTAIKRQLRFMFIYPLFYLISWIPPLVYHFTLYSDEAAAHPNFALACISTCFVALQCFVDAAIFSYRETPWRYAKQNIAVPDIDRTTDSNTAIDSASNPSSWQLFQRKQQGETSNSSSTTNPVTTAPHSRSDSHTFTPRGSFIHRLSHPFRSSIESNPVSTRGSGIFSKQGKSRGEMLAEARAARHRRELEIETARVGQEERQRARKQSIVRRGGADRSWWEVEGRRRKDSVLLGLDTDITRTRSRGTTNSGTTSATNEVAARSGSPVGSGSTGIGLFSPRRFRGSFAKSPEEVSPGTRAAMATSGENASGGEAVGSDSTSSPPLAGNIHPTTSAGSPRELEQVHSMPVLEEEDDGPLATSTMQ